LVAIGRDDQVPPRAGHLGCAAARPATDQGNDRHGDSRQDGRQRADGASFPGSMLEMGLSHDSSLPVAGCR